MSESDKIINGAHYRGDLALQPAGMMPSLPSALEQESLQRIAESYVRYYAAGEGHTARAKRYDLQHFLTFLAGSEERIPLIRVADWTLERTQAFVDYRLSLGEAPATVGRRLATIKHFGRTLAERVHGYINPAREVKGPVQRPSKPRGLTEEEVEALRAAAQPSDSTKFSAIRNQFLLELLLATGLRADEVRLLTLLQISDDGCWLKNVKTKGRKFRNVYLDSQIRRLMHSYLERREVELSRALPDLASLPRAERAKYPLFISLAGARIGEPLTFGLSPKTVWRIIASIGRRAQSTCDGPHLHPHVLRHTFAHGLLDSSKDIRLVAQALGHSDVRTTMRYTERTEEEIASAIESKISRR